MQCFLAVRPPDHGIRIIPIVDYCPTAASIYNHTTTFVHISILSQITLDMDIQPDYKASFIQLCLVYQIGHPSMTGWDGMGYTVGTGVATASQIAVDKVWHMIINVKNSDGNGYSVQLFFTIDMNCVSAYPLLFPCLQSRYQCLKCENAELSCLVQKASLVFGQVVRDQETAHEEFFVRADGPNLTGNQIYCICRSRTRRRYTDERNITRYCSGRALQRFL